MSFIYVGLISFLCLVLVTLLHYQALGLMTDYIVENKKLHGRFRMVFVLSGIMTAHIAEILLYALGFIVIYHFGWGYLEGFVGSTESWAELLYYSAVSYTSLGLGEMYPVHGFRFITSVEALHGLVLIGWSASYVYIVMEKVWLRKSSK